VQIEEDHILTEIIREHANVTAAAVVTSPVPRSSASTATLLPKPRSHNRARQEARQQARAVVPSIPLAPGLLLKQKPTPPKPNWNNTRPNLPLLPIDSIGLSDRVMVIIPVEVIGQAAKDEDRVGFVWDYTTKHFLIWTDSRHNIYRAFTSVKLLSKGPGCRDE